MITLPYATVRNRDASILMSNNIAADIVFTDIVHIMYISLPFDTVKCYMTK